MDDMDVAQEREQLDRELALQAMRSRLASDDAGSGNGVCEGCGEEIDPRRLAAMPHASRCVECQQQLEKYGV